MMRRLAAAAVLCAVVAACGDDGAGQAAPTCPVHRTAVAEVTGLVLGAKVEPEVSGGDVHCTFRAADGITSVAITTWTDDETFMAALTDRITGAEAVELAFADDALWSASTSTLYATAEDRGVTVSVLDLTDLVDDPLRAASAIAADALD